VSPKIEPFRRPARIKIVQGGRAAGAKSWGIASLLIQKAQYHHRRIVCLREVQKSLEESVYQLMNDTIERLRYPYWVSRVDHIINTKTKSKIIFRGLRDLRAAHQIKGLEGYTDFWLEEASVISEDSLMLLMPTIVRNPDAELWISYNPETEMDPVTLRFWESDREDMIKVRVEPGKIDNPWWDDSLTHEMDIDYARDPDEAEHVWGGQPRKQGHNSVMSRVLIRQAMTRNIESEGQLSVGCDPADFGDDRTQIYVRKGLKIIDHKEITKMDGGFIAGEIKRMINGRPDIPIKVDTTGIGASTRDFLRRMGLKVIPVNFGGTAKDKNKYANVASEMWFTFPIDEADIPDDPELMQELSGRLYDYDSKNRYIVEAKDIFKKRLKRSPDKADALLLTYYEGHSIIMSEDQRKQLSERWRHK